MEPPGWVPCRTWGRPPAGSRCTASGWDRLRGPLRPGGRDAGCHAGGMAAGPQRRPGGRIVLHLVPRRGHHGHRRRPRGRRGPRRPRLERPRHLSHGGCPRRDDGRRVGPKRCARGGPHAGTRSSTPFLRPSSTPATGRARGRRTPASAPRPERAASALPEARLGAAASTRPVRRAHMPKGPFRKVSGCVSAPSPTARGPSPASGRGCRRS